MTSKVWRIQPVDAIVCRTLPVGNRRSKSAKHSHHRQNIPFEKIVDAHRFLASNEQFGKIVVTA
jgi:hypothetical protein